MVKFAVGDRVRCTSWINTLPQEWQDEMNGIGTVIEVVPSGEHKNPYGEPDYSYDLLRIKIGNKKHVVNEHQIEAVV